MLSHRGIYATLIIVALTTLTGCWDKVELSDRAFVISLGIDKGDGKDGARYKLSAAVPELAAFNGDGGSTEELKKVMNAEDKTMSEAFAKIDSQSNKKLYFGHIKLIVFSEDVLKDSVLFSEAVDALERNPEISRRVLTMSCKGSAEDVLKAKTSGSLVGMFITDYFRNNERNSFIGYKQDMEGLIRQMFNGGAVLPQIAVKDDDISLGGSAVIKDRQLSGWIDEDDMLGYVLIKGKDSGGIVSVKDADNENYVPLTLTGSKSSIDFGEYDGALKCFINIDVYGGILEYVFERELGDEQWSKLAPEYEAGLEKTVSRTLHRLQKELNADGLELSKELNKKNPELWRKYGGSWDDTYKNMTFSVHVGVTLENAGVIK